MTASREAVPPATTAGGANETEAVDFVCTACGCMCDDLRLAANGRRVVAVQPPCPLAEAFFLREPESFESPCLIDGKPADSEAALERAAEILRAASAPLVMGFECATVEAQRQAVELADKLGAFLDPTDDRGFSRNHTSMQTVGAVTATLGEVAARSDLIVYWNVDPAMTHPRHMERFARRPYSAPPAPSSKRRVITVGAARSKTSAASDDFLELKPGADEPALTTLRLLLSGGNPDLALVAAQTGASLEQWSYLAQRLKMAKYAAIFYEPVAGDPGGPDVLSLGVADLVRELHRHTRAAALRLGSPWNAAGAAQVLAWQTGFPAAVSFANGYPAYSPGEASAQALLERGEVDAVLIIGADPAAHLSAAAKTHLDAIPSIVINDRTSLTANAAQVAMLTSRFGIETTGSVFRADGVALPLKAAVASPLPDAESLLTQLCERATRD